MFGFQLFQVFGKYAENIVTGESRLFLHSEPEHIWTRTGGLRELSEALNVLSEERTIDPVLVDPLPLFFLYESQ